MSGSHFCPDCDQPGGGAMNRRDFVRTTGTAAAAAAAMGIAGPSLVRADGTEGTPENLVEKLYNSLTPAQKEKMCFAWNHEDDRGLLRTHVSNNWNITDPRTMNVGGAFYTTDQQEMIEALFFSLYNPEWHDRIRKQLRDDAGGYGRAQSIAIFGEPGTDQFEFVMTGRHLTIRCDGNSAEHVAFGGPIFYGHAAEGFNEAADHPGNVYWDQAKKANALFQMLDGQQREKALIDTAPYESEVAFQGPEGRFPGIPVRELTTDQKEHAQGVLASLLEPYRTSNVDEARTCLREQGGLDACSLAFYREDDIGNDGVWDIWRIEGPSFVWHYRGAPHVHVWVNVANDPNVELNAAG